MWTLRITGREGSQRSSDGLPQFSLVLGPGASHLSSLGLSFLRHEEGKFGMGDLQDSLVLQNYMIFLFVFLNGSSGHDMMKLSVSIVCLVMQISCPNRLGEKANLLTQGPGMYASPLCPSVWGILGHCQKLEPDPLGSNSWSVAYCLCDLGQ